MAQKFLIYGASGGIGGAVARRLHDDGHSLHLAGRDHGRLSMLAQELGAGSTAGDVCARETFAQTAADAGEVLDGLVYAVGTINLRSLLRLTADDFLTDFQINAVGAALAIQAALPALKKAPNGASIVLFSSVAAQQGFSLHASTGMAKAAVAGLTLSLAAELAPRVRVNAIAPSLTRTSMAQPLISSDQAASAIAALHALPRLGTPEDMASLTTFLLSPAAGWITGQIVGVDGGRSTLRTKH